MTTEFDEFQSHCNALIIAHEIMKREESDLRSKQNGYKALYQKRIQSQSDLDSWRQSKRDLELSIDVLTQSVRAVSKLRAVIIQLWPEEGVSFIITTPKDIKYLVENNSGCIQFIQSIPPGDKFEICSRLD